jgi:hypothetical protein
LVSNVQIGYAVRAISSGVPEFSYFMPKNSDKS